MYDRSSPGLLDRCAENGSARYDAAARSFIIAPHFEPERLAPCGIGLEQSPATAAGLIFLTGASLAQDGPIVPCASCRRSRFAASDIVGNVVAENLTRRFNHCFLVENQAGRGGQIASVAVARAAPGGYTFLLPSLATRVFSPLVARSFNPVADFTNIAFIGGSPAVLAVHPSLNVHSLNELTAMLRKRAEPWRHVSSGVGTPGHLLGEYWAHRRPMA